MYFFCRSVFQIIKDLVTLFPVIRDWIVEFLDENKDMTASMVGRNMLIEQVCDVTGTRMNNCRVLAFSLEASFLPNNN